MLTFREIRDCEGYYYNVRTGEVLRNVGPGETRCWSGEPGAPWAEVFEAAADREAYPPERIRSARLGST